MEKYEKHDVIENSFCHELVKLGVKAKIFDHEFLGIL